MAPWLITDEWLQVWQFYCLQVRPKWWVTNHLSTKGTNQLPTTILALLCSPVWKWQFLVKNWAKQLDEEVSIGFELCRLVGKPVSAIVCRIFSLFERVVLSSGSVLAMATKGVVSPLLPLLPIWMPCRFGGWNDIFDCLENLVPRPFIEEVNNKDLRPFS